VFEPNQRVKVNLSGLTIKGVAFSQNVQEALGTIVYRVSAEPPTYLVELLFSFKASSASRSLKTASGERSSRARRTLEATNDLLLEMNLRVYELFVTPLRIEEKDIDPGRHQNGCGAGEAAYQVRAGYQPQDRQSTRPDDPAVAAAAGGPVIEP
jgi:hypothetical protein